MNGTQSKQENDEKNAMTTLPLIFIAPNFRTQANAKPAPIPPKNPTNAGNDAKKFDEGFITNIAPKNAPSVARKGTNFIFSPSKIRLKIIAKNDDILFKIAASAIGILSSA